MNSVSKTMNQMDEEKEHIYIYLPPHSPEPNELFQNKL